MDTVETSIKTTPDKRLSQWLFNPFKFVAGYYALFFGLVIILISGFVCRLGYTHFDGVLDVHKGLSAPLWLFLSEGLINWLSMAVPLFFFGLIISPSSFRMIDVVGTQALARWPYLITAVIMLPEANLRAGMYLASKVKYGFTTTTINYTDMLIFVPTVIIIILMIVWTVVLMYRAYSVSCNVKGTKAIITFIVALISAEVFSKFAILLLFA